MTEDKAKKPFVFVVMPFKKAFDDIYKLGIKAACEEAGCECERVDEQKFTKFILDQVYEQIAKADFIVAELSEPNINVYYEVGYAHSQGKDVILVAQKEKQIPFDLKYYPFIIYDGVIHQLKDQLGDKAKWAAEESKKKPAKASPPQSEDNIEEIKRLLDEIDHFRGLEGKDVKARKLENIKRLIELEVKPLNLERCNLKGEVLSFFNFERANLQEANLQEANLQEANLRDANLQGANLQEANLQEANLRDANLQGANLQGAHLLEADLFAADLQRADLRYAYLRKANLAYTYLTEVRILTFELLAAVGSLFGVKGLKPKFEKKLKKEKPELFEEPKE